MPAPAESRPAAQFRLDPKLVKRVRVRARVEGRNPCRLIDDAIRLYFDSLRKPAGRADGSAPLSTT